MKCSSALLDNTKFIAPVYNQITPPISYIQPNQGNTGDEGECKCNLTDPTSPSTNPTAWSKDPKIWGPHLWSYLHYSALNYNPTEEDAMKMKEWLKFLSITIPCKNCSNHYSAYLSKYSDDQLYHICCDKDKLFNLLVDIHNAVNVRNNKKVISYDEARQMFSS